MRGHCPTCGADKFAHIEAEVDLPWDNDNTGESGTTYHRILRCGGCDEIYFQTMEVATMLEEPQVEHWPPPQRRPLPAWLRQLDEIDDLLYVTLLETQIAANRGMYTLAAIGIRTIFDRSSEKLGVNANMTFAEKLDELVNLRKIGGEERDALATLTNAGSAAAHRAWRPSVEQLDTMLDTIENFVHRSFFVTRAAAELASQVPARPPRGQP